MRQKSSMGSYRRGQLIFVWSMIIIPIIGWFIFFVYVNASSFVQAFQDVNGNFTWYNFEQVFASFRGDIDGRGGLGIAMRNTFSYFGQHIILIFPLQIIMAYFLYKQIPGYKVFRIIFYLPNIISSVVMVNVFKEFIAADGPIGVLCKQWGLFPQGGFLGNIDTAHATILFYCFWSGINTHLLVCGAMAKIPLEVLESARLDGVQAGRELISIVLPLIWPTLSTILILSCTGLINSSGPILLMTNDAYTYGCTTISYWIFEKVWTGSIESGKYTLVSATGLTLTVIIVPIVLGLRKLLEKIPTVEY